MVYVVVAEDGQSSTRVAVFSNREIALKYCANMQADGWVCTMDSELVLNRVPVNQKHSASYIK